MRVFSFEIVYIKTEKEENEEEAAVGNQVKMKWEKTNTNIWWFDITRSSD